MSGESGTWCSDSMFAGTNLSAVQFAQLHVLLLCSSSSFVSCTVYCLNGCLVHSCRGLAAGAGLLNLLMLLLDAAARWR
jgi:hypothetical protein